MAHGITSTDTMFSVRATPWHKLGSILPEVVNASEAIAAANLGWTVRKETLTTTAGQPVNGFYATVREDTGAVLGVVGEHYAPLQNEEAFRFFDKVANDPNGAKFHTAGSLHGGRRVWMLAKLPTFVKVKDDVTEEYLLLANSHDGSSSVSMQFTPVRVVCQNTLSLALSGKQTRFSTFHRGDVLTRVLEAQDVLGIAQAQHEIFAAQVEFMASVKPSTEQVNNVLRSLFPEPDTQDSPGTKAAATRAENVREEVHTIFRTSDTCTVPGAKGTGWGLYNALTEFSDHRETKATDDSRVDSSWYGTGRDFKIRALNSVLAIR